MRDLKMEVSSINPYNLEKIKTHKETSPDEIQFILEKAKNASLIWRQVSLFEKIELFKKLSDILKYDCDDFSFLITQEMGKLFKESQSEVIKCADTCDYYIKNITDFLSPQKKINKGTVVFEPLGVILGIMPWNFPFWQVFRFAIPTLFSGNTILLKHSSQVTGCALEIEKIFLQAGFPKDVFQTLVVPSNKIKSIIENEIIQGISLTGSTDAGKNVASIAGAHLKKCVLELGGSDPYIVFADADIENTVEICNRSRMLNAGQSCISAKRFIIHSSIYEEFKILLKQKFEKLEIGDPMFSTTTLAPLSSLKQRDELHEQVLGAIKHGAQLFYGGTYPIAKGAFYYPTILENISKDNPAYKAEFFGPVACLYKFDTTEQAIEIANATAFGLGAAIFSKDSEMAENLITKKIQAGICGVNQMVQSSPEFPFGGTKESGYGRELSQFGIYEFTNIKTILSTTSGA